MLWAQHPAAMQRLVQYLENTPFLRHPKTKKMSGEFRGVIQYDVSRGDRVWYRVQGNVVRIEYAGKHPKETE